VRWCWQLAARVLAERWSWQRTQPQAHRVGMEPQATKQEHKAGRRMAEAALMTLREAQRLDAVEASLRPRSKFLGW
jgi:hypothetical protein